MFPTTNKRPSVPSRSLGLFTFLPFESGGGPEGRRTPRRYRDFAAHAFDLALLNDVRNCERFPNEFKLKELRGDLLL
jgi:hypothetical protein